MRSPLLYLGVLLVLVLCSALIAPYFIDWSIYRADIERYASRLVGRDVRIGGDVRIAILPTPVLSVTDLRIANLEGAVTEDFLRADSLEIRVALSPLLKGEVDVQSLAFDGAAIELERIRGAGNNWYLAPTGGWTEFLSAEDIEVSSATITNSAVVFRDGQRGGLARLDNVDLEVSAASLAGPYRVRGTLTHEDKLLFASVQTGRMSAQGSMRLSVTLEPDGEYVPIYSFDGKVVPQGASSRLDGKLKIRRDLPVLVEDAPPLDTAEVGLPFLLTSKVSADFSRIDISDIEFLIDQAQPGSHISGNMTVGLGDELRLDAALETRHLDLDRLSDRGGVTLSDLAPGLATVDRIAQLVRAAPADLRGTFRFNANALTVGHETVEGVELSAMVDGPTLKVSRAAAVLPGRSQIVLSGLDFAVRNGIAGFEGDIALSSRDTRGFVAWTMPAASSYLEARPRALKGAATLRGRIAIDGRSIGVRQGTLDVDGTTAEGALLVVPGRKPEFFGDITASNIDFDRYLPAASQPPVGKLAGDPLSRLFAGMNVSALSTFNGKFNLRSGPFVRWGLKGDGLSAAVEVNEGTVKLARTNVSGFNGIDFGFDADIRWFEDRPRGRIRASVRTDRLASLMRIPPARHLFAETQGRVSELLTATGTADLETELSSETADGRDVQSATLRGRLGAATVDIEAAFHRAAGAPEVEEIDVSGAIESADSAALLRYAGLDARAGRELPGTVRFDLSGKRTDGLDLSVEADLLYTRVNVGGLVTEGDGALSVQTEVVIASSDARPAFETFGLLAAGSLAEPAGLSVKGLVALDDGQLVVTGLGGDVAGLPVGIDGTVDFSSGKAKVFGHLTIARLNMPWAVSQALSLSLDRAEAANAAESWGSEPFDLAFLREADLNLAVRAGEVTVLGETRAEQLRAEVVARDGVLKVSGLDMKLAGGRLSGDVSATERDGLLSLDASYELSDAELGEAISSEEGEAYLTGRYSIAGTLKGAGRSPAGLVSTLSGQARFTAPEAALTGVNPLEFSKALQQSPGLEDLDRLLSSVLVDGRMLLSGLESDVTVKNGIVRFSPSDFEGSAAEGEVSASLDLSGWTLSNNWTIGLKSYQDTPSLTVRLSGPISAPRRSYNTGALRSFLTVKGLSEGVEQLEILQKEEEERIKRLERIEKQVRLNQARLDEEKLMQGDEALLAPVPAVPDDDPQRDSLRPSDERTVRVSPESPLQRSPDTPSETGSVPETASIPDPDTVTPDDPDVLPGELPVEQLPGGDDVDADVFVREVPDLDAPSGEADVNEVGDGPVDITPRTNRNASGQDRLFSDDPTEWRK